MSYFADFRCLWAFSDNGWLNWYLARPTYLRRTSPSLSITFRSPLRTPLYRFLHRTANRVNRQMTIQLISQFCGFVRIVF